MLRPPKGDGLLRTRWFETWDFIRLVYLTPHVCVGLVFLFFCFLKKNILPASFWGFESRKSRSKLMPPKRTPEEERLDLSRLDM